MAINWTVRCPNCGQIVNFSSLSCGGEDCLSSKYGVLRLFSTAFYEKFHSHEQGLSKAREAEGVRVKDTRIYEQLPHLDNVLGRNLSEWKAFREDLAIIEQRLKGKQGLKVLNYGSWNGWLSNHLVKWGHHPLAIAYFIDAYDGLGAQQFYQNNWSSIQMDIEGGLAILEDQFDVIILNRGVSFLVDPAKTVQELIDKLSPGGRLIITGFNYYRNTQQANERFAQHRKMYREKHGLELLFTPTKGYLSQADISAIRTLGVQLKAYPNKYLQNARALLFHGKSTYTYGYFKNNKE